MRTTRLCLLFGFAFLVAGAVSGCSVNPYELNSPAAAPISADQQQQHKAMLGKWYGNQPLKEGGTHEWVMQRGDQGQYLAEFKTTDKNGNVRRQSEVGLWGVSGDVYFTIFMGYPHPDGIHLVDSSDPYNYDAYYILNLDETAFEYKNARSGSTYKVIKKPDDFVLD